jgi:hypothetical protein
MCHAFELIGKLIPTDHSCRQAKCPKNWRFWSSAGLACPADSDHREKTLLSVMTGVCNALFPKEIAALTACGQ